MTEPHRTVDGLDAAAEVMRGVPPERTLVLLSDIHGNMPALEAVLREVERLGVPDRRIANLGDVFGYGPQAFDVIERAQEFHLNVLGNHDFLALASFRRNLADLLGMTDDEMLKDPILQVTIAQSVLLEDPEIRLFVEQMPAGVKLGERGLLIHDSPRSYGRTVVPQDRLLTPFAVEEAFECMDREGVRVAIHGHNHTPTVTVARPAPPPGEPAGPGGDETPMPAPLGGVRFRPEARYIVDIGAVGQPRDGDPRASFAVLRTGDGGDPEEIALVRVPYPVDDTMDRIKRAGYPASFARRLEWGV